jgi:hypothetical protein
MMTPEQTQLFNQAVSLAQSGDKSTAYSELKQLSRATGAKDPNLLLWLAFTSPDLEEAETAIGMAESYAPFDPNVATARTWLTQEKAKRTISPVVSAVPVAPSFNQPRPQPQIQSSNFTYAPQPQTSAQIRPYIAPDRRPRKVFPKWAILVIGVLLIGIVALVVVNLLTPPEPTYKVFTTPDDMVATAVKGDHVKFTTKLSVSQGVADDVHDVYLWSDAKNLDTAVFIRFPREGKLRPSRRAATYFAVVTDQSKDEKFLYLDAEKTDAAEADLLPPPIQIGAKATRVVRSNVHPDLGNSYAEQGLLWTIVNVEITAPADNTGVLASQINSDVKSTRLRLVSKNPSLSGYYNIEFSNLKSQTVGNKLVLTGQIVAMTPPDWLDLQWVGLLDQQYITVPLKL